MVERNPLEFIDANLHSLSSDPDLILVAGKIKLIVTMQNNMEQFSKCKHKVKRLLQFFGFII